MMQEPRRVSTLTDFAILQEIGMIFSHEVFLGRGAYSQVYKVRRYADQRIYAMKKIDFGGFSQKEKDNALLEISILKEVQSPNVIQVCDAFLTDENKLLW